ncbi:hypothetical protein BsWGS_26848 [Bradybaena similaris]
MTSVMRMKSASTGCGYLMSQDHFTYGGKSDDTEEDRDSSSKPRKHMQTLENKGVILHELSNMNNSNKPAALYSVRRQFLNQGVVFDDVSHTQNTVPVPVAWSPGMMLNSNPLLMITPQKPSLSANEPFLSTKENILEPQSANKIPKPVAWSPGMTVKPDPNLFITPEKVPGKKIIASVSSDDRQTTENGSCDIRNIPTKTKNSYSVRFDLPSSTSEDESKDAFSETDSPITIRGRDLDVKEFSFESPDLKPFCFKKMYNPGIYSDDSSLDESILNPLPKASIDKSYRLQTSSGITKSLSDNSSIQASFCSELPNCTSVVTESAGNATKPCTFIADNFAKTVNKDAQSSVSSTRLHRMKPKSNSAVNTRTKALSEKKKMQLGPKFIGKSDRLSSQLSAAESPPEGPTVIREMKHHLLSTKYSFPFELTAAAEGSEYEHIFARPEFNTTLAMREELDNLQEQEVDVMKAVQATLARSEVKRAELNEKAAVYTNRMSGQFNNLIDLNTSVESLCDRVVRMRTSKIPGKRRVTHREKKFSESQRAPDLMEFFTSDLQKECPDLTLPGVTLVTSQPVTSPYETAFDLYRHNRLWQGIGDF